MNNRFLCSFCLQIHERDNSKPQKKLHWRNWSIWVCTLARIAYSHTRSHTHTLARIHSLGCLRNQLTVVLLGSIAIAIIIIVGVFAAQGKSNIFKHSHALTLTLTRPHTGQYSTSQASGRTLITVYELFYCFFILFSFGSEELIAAYWRITEPCRCNGDKSVCLFVCLV